MSRLKDTLARPKVPVVLFILAAILLCVATVGGTRAALTYFSDTYTARLNVSNIGVSLIENDDEVVAWRNYAGNDRWDEGSSALLTTMLPAGQKLELGRQYPEKLTVQNTGTIGSFVRVSLQKYWENADGQKVRTVSPELIRVKLAADSGWIEDAEASTTERTVFYFNRALAPGEVTPLICESVSIDPAVAAKVTQTTEETVGDDGKVYTTITTVYDYDGLRFCLEATVDAVQEHNAIDAIRSAWGVSASLNDGILSLE